MQVAEIAQKENACIRAPDTIEYMQGLERQHKRLRSQKGWCQMSNDRKTQLLWTPDDQQRLEVLNNKIASCRAELKLYEEAFLSAANKKRRWQESQVSVTHCKPGARGVPRNKAAQVPTELGEIVKRYNLSGIFAQVARATRAQCGGVR